MHKLSIAARPALPSVVARDDVLDGESAGRGSEWPNARASAPSGRKNRRGWATRWVVGRWGGVGEAVWENAERERAEAGSGVEYAMRCGWGGPGVEEGGWEGCKWARIRELYELCGWAFLPFFVGCFLGGRLTETNRRIGLDSCRHSRGLSLMFRGALGESESESEVVLSTVSENVPSAAAEARKRCTSISDVCLVFRGPLRSLAPDGLYRASPVMEVNDKFGREHFRGWITALTRHIEQPERPFPNEQTHEGPWDHLRLREVQMLSRALTPENRAPLEALQAERNVHPGLSSD
ncbi:hypothetical protein PSPO01_13403 [Paraphaeosphaeria sporulosa]